MLERSAAITLSLLLNLVLISVWIVHGTGQTYCTMFEAHERVIKTSNKHIKIADGSDGGWETVRQYQSSPVASESDDESKINKAGNSALRKRNLRGRFASDWTPLVLSNGFPTPITAICNLNMFIACFDLFNYFSDSFTCMHNFRVINGSNRLC
jgi:hypothetical protein